MHTLKSTSCSPQDSQHSTKTVVLSVLNDIIRAADEGEVICLALLDLVWRSTQSTRTFYSMTFSVVGLG